MKTYKFGLALMLFFAFFLSTNNIIAQKGESRPLPQFLFTDFSKGTIKMKAGATYSATLNYNTVDEEFVMNQNGTYIALIDIEKIDTLYLNNRKFVPFDKVFLEVIVGQRLPIFIQQKSRYSPVGSKSAYGLTSQTNGPTAVAVVRGANQVRFLDMPENVEVTYAPIYWIKIDGRFNKFTNERQFIKLFPGKEDALKEFMKKKRIDIKRKEDLFILDRFAESL
jgi:hypothetical protein